MALALPRVTIEQPNASRGLFRLRGGRDNPAVRMLGTQICPTNTPNQYQGPVRRGGDSAMTLLELKPNDAAEIAHAIRHACRSAYVRDAAGVDCPVARGQNRCLGATISAMRLRPPWAGMGNSISVNSFALRMATRRFLSASAPTAARWRWQTIGMSRCASRPSIRRGRIEVPVCRKTRS